MADKDVKHLVFTADGELVGAAQVQGADVVFPNPDIKWVWVLDARHEPYDTMALPAILDRARRVRKNFVLVSEANN